MSNSLSVRIIDSVKYRFSKHIVQPLLLFYYLSYFNFRKTSNKIHICIFVDCLIDLNYLKEFISLSQSEYDIFIFGDIDTDHFPDYLLNYKSVRLFKNKSHLVQYFPFDFLLTPFAGKPPITHEITRKVHIIHSLASAHIIYKEGVFDSFDYIYCATHYHIHEFQSLLKSKEKNFYLIRGGYEIVDRLKCESRNKKGIERVILFAPSWGKNNSLVTFGFDFIEKNIERFKIIFRPHPLSYQLDKEAITNIIRRFGNHSNFILNTDSDSYKALLSSEYLVTDYSGISFEFAFAFHQPVFFLDSELKLINENWSKYINNKGAVYENRNKIGVLLDTDFNMEQYICSEDWKTNLVEQIKQLEKEQLFNIGCSANYLKNFLQNKSPHEMEGVESTKQQ